MSGLISLRTDFGISGCAAALAVALLLLAWAQGANALPIRVGETAALSGADATATHGG